jgi:hypothetical protein
MNDAVAAMRLADLSVVDVLVDYDGPRLFTCRNTQGEYYIAAFVDEDDETESYLYASVPEDRLRDALAGRIALREVYQLPSAAVVWVVSKALGSTATGVRVIRPDEIPEQWLPGENVRLTALKESEAGKVGDVLSYGNPSAFSIRARARRRRGFAS